MLEGKNISIFLMILICIPYALDATGLIRTTVKKISSKNIGIVANKPVKWIMSTKLYKKHPRLVQAVGLVPLGLLVRAAYIKGKNIYENYRNRFFRAAARGDINMVRRYLRNGGDVNATFKSSF